MKFDPLPVYVGNVWLSVGLDRQTILPHVWAAATLCTMCQCPYWVKQLLSHSLTLPQLAVSLCYLLSLFCSRRLSFPNLFNPKYLTHSFYASLAFLHIITPSRFIMPPPLFHPSLSHLSPVYSILQTFSLFQLAYWLVRITLSDRLIDWYRGNTFVLPLPLSTPTPLIPLLTPYTMAPSSSSPRREW